MRYRLFQLTIAVAVVCMPRSALAQSDTATISGRIADYCGDVIPGVLALAAAGQPPSGSAPANPQPIDPTQEIAKEQPEGPAIAAGTTEIRIGGYLGVTGIFRSINGGGGPSTNFGTIPYSDTADGSLSEARLTAQPSRLSIRVNAAPAPGRA